MSHKDQQQAGTPAAATRADIWLWAARFYKTRALAAAACNGGKARRGGHPVKPSTLLRPGDVLVVSADPCPREIRVEAVLRSRVSAVLAADCFTELTDPAVLAAAREAKRNAAIHHVSGHGRPTKFERRQIDALRKALGDMGYPKGDETGESGG